MKRLLLTSFLLLLWVPLLRAQVQYTTERPRVEDVNDKDVTIRRVELTEQYTIIYMTFQASGKRTGQRSWPFSIPLPNGGETRLDNHSNIGFQPNARLYVNQGERSFKLIRAENIPAEMRRRVDPGEEVDFVAYFERITPGYTVFDLFECKDYVEGATQIVCFNFWGVHIINPARKPKDTSAQRTPRPKPLPPVSPRVTEKKPPYTPRTTPGVGNAPGDTPAKPEVEVAPAPITIAINGLTRDAKTKKLILATVTYRLLSGAEATGDGPADSVRSTLPTGTYKIPVDVRGVYAVTASAKGYFSQSDTLATNRIDVTRNFDLMPIAAGTKITLRAVYFNVSKYDLKPESFPELDRLVSVMQENPTMTIKLEGHTDTVGDFDANVELSRNRVDEVKRYIVSKGIGAGRIETIGYGPSRPINTNKSLKERPENRRVEMVVVKV